MRTSFQAWVPLGCHEPHESAFPGARREEDDGTDRRRDSGAACGCAASGQSFRMPSEVASGRIDGMETSKIGAALFAHYAGTHLDRWRQLVGWEVEHVDGRWGAGSVEAVPVSYTHLRAHET